MKILKTRFQQYMVPLHLDVHPITASEFQKAQFNLHLNNVSNLATNACLARKCPFYMKKMKSVAGHLKDIDVCIPAFHKTVKMMCNREPENVFRTICLAGKFDCDEVVK